MSSQLTSPFAISFRSQAALRRADASELERVLKSEVRTRSYEREGWAHLLPRWSSLIATRIEELCHSESNPLTKRMYNPTRPQDRPRAASFLTPSQINCLVLFCC